MFFDALPGRRTRSMIIPDSDPMILSVVQVASLMERFSGGDAA